MTEQYVNRKISFLYETQDHIDHFSKDRFREFYHQSEFFEHSLHKRSNADLAICIQEDVDFISSSVRLTPMTISLTVEIFGLPEDSLITDAGDITDSAKEALRRITHFRDRIVKTWDISHLGLSAYSLTLNAVNFKLFIGRRCLGTLKYESFKKHIADVTSLKRLVRGHRFHSDDLVAQEIAGEPINVTSYDSILDRARAAALDIFPFPDQTLLKRIMTETDNTRVLQMALQRLEKIPENEQIFDNYLDSKDYWIRNYAILGTTNVRRLRKLLSGGDAFEKEFIATRIAVIEKDLNILSRIAVSARHYLSQYTAIEAIVELVDDISWLDNIQNGIKGDTPKDTNSRLLIEGKKAFLAGNGDRLNNILKEASFDIKNPILQMKHEFERMINKAPEVFISYKHESQEHNNWVKRLATDLRDNGINALLDEWEIDLGESVSEYMASKVSSAKAMLFIITNASLAAVEADKNTRNALKFEFQIANARRYSAGDFRIIGILRSGERPPNHISDNLYLDFRKDEEYEQHLKKLINSLLGKTERPKLKPMNNEE